MDKQALRERIWDALEAEGEARFPFPPHGRIPNFAGAEAAAKRLADTAEWQTASAIKANPDAPQRPVRRRALEGGKTVYMAVPRLRAAECFLRLTPAKIDDVDHATTIGGSSELGEPVGPEAIESIDLIVSGSVAVTEGGPRVGKGEGYSDLEFGILREFDLVDDETTVTTTVHEMQVVDASVETTPQDVPMDLVVTPERTIRTDGTGGKPSGVAWDVLDADRIEKIPVLSELDSS
jgi:5-formyltetrahydrofolate cyclo-ligase